MYILGLFLALLIGVVLGLVGGGGSILTVPLVHYFFDESLLIATSYSLFIVAVASGVGVLQRLKSDVIDFKNGVVFVIPSMITAFVIRAFVMPMFPLNFAMSDWQLSRDTLISILLIVVMLFTAFRTLYRKDRIPPERIALPTIVFFGIITGSLSGFIGAGGGFIIVPILLRLGLEMKRAIGTSMFIICVQSFVALGGDFLNDEIDIQHAINWNVLGILTLVTMSGVFVGSYLQNIFTGKVLRKVFSGLLILVAFGITLEFIYNK